MLFKRELKRNLKSFLIISLACSAMAMYVIAIAPSFGNDIQKILDLKLPQGMQKAFGMKDLDFRSATSFFAIMFSYIFLFYSIYLASAFANIVSKEYSDKTAEYLFSLPAKRVHFILVKLSVIFIYAVLSVLLIFLISWFSFGIFIKGGYDLTPVVLMAVAWLLGGLVFGSAGFLISSFFSRTRISSAVSVGFVLFMYIFQVVISINEKISILKHFSPFDWFKGSEIANSASISLAYCLVAIGFSAICFYFGIWRFRKMDVLI